MTRNLHYRKKAEREAKKKAEQEAKEAGIWKIFSDSSAKCDFWFKIEDVNLQLQKYFPLRNLEIIQTLPVLFISMLCCFQPSRSQILGVGFCFQELSHAKNWIEWCIMTRGGRRKMTFGGTFLNRWHDWAARGGRAVAVPVFVWLFSTVLNTWLRQDRGGADLGGDAHPGSELFDQREANSYHLAEYRVPMSGGFKNFDFDTNPLCHKDKFSDLL